MPEVMPENMPAALCMKIMPAFPFELSHDFNASTFGILQIIMLA
jgi:hypothetical protein